MHGRMINNCKYLENTIYVAANYIDCKFENQFYVNTYCVHKQNIVIYL